jgi:hypothetical protein
MITPIDRSQLHLVRGGAAANAPRVQPQPATDTKPNGKACKLAKDVHDLVIEAYEGGLAAGEEQHFRSGWRWGMVAGMLWGAVMLYAAQRLLQWAGWL